MKKYLSLAVIAVLIPIAAFANIEDVVPTETWLLQVLTFLGTLKGATTLGIAGAVTQLVMVFAQTPIAAFTGRYRFILVSLLAFVGTVIGAVATGSPLILALGTAPVLNAFMVFVNQAYKQIVTPKGSV